MGFFLRFLAVAGKTAILQVWTRAFEEANESLQAMIRAETEAFQEKLTRAQQLLRELSKFFLKKK
eukprot:m.123491 g.123491  ORF g.123491 m.123491 type:complete len:65 (-) comp15574_c0_seq9:8-202(-)